MPDHLSMTVHFVRNRGFTLVELVVILVLAGTLAAVALPRFFDATAFHSRGFFDEVVNAARYGQKLAVASGCDVELRVTPAGYALQQRVDSCTGGAFIRDVPKPSGSGPFACAPPSGVVLSVSDSSGAVSVVFDSLGRASPDGVTVSVDGRSFTIVGESGYVNVL
jgi:MSHA pilin protein MshC